MRVEQQQQNQSMVDLIQQASKPEEKEKSVLFGDAVKTKQEEKTDSQSVFVKDATYLNPAKEEQKTIMDEIEEGSAMDADERKNQMAVLSNTTSAEDYAKMKEDGFSLDSTATNTIITVTDKIKAELAKAGVDISCFGDDLDTAELEAIAGSPELATQLANAMRQADIPVTNDNIKESVEVIDMTTALKKPEDGAIKYLLDNHLAPTVENLYKAEYSGSSNYAPAGAVDTTSFEGQIQSVIREAGLSVNEDTMATSQWMLENDIPLTAENVSYAQELRDMELPTNTEEIIDRTIEALQEGDRPKDTILLNGYSLTQQAEQAMDVVNEATEDDLQYVVERGMDLTIENLKTAEDYRAGGEADQGTGQGTGQEAGQNQTEPESGNIEQEYHLIVARRQLEELRLAMTAEANYALLKRGISIDTEPIEQLVKQLKEQENVYYQSLLTAQGVDATKENVDLFCTVTERVEQIKTVPAYVLGITNAKTTDINGVYEAGSALKATFEEANERYETLMTAPRADMGDSIQKAFRNVDDILKDIDMETSEENRRAVRILGYNELSITQESVTKMKAADEEVQRTFANMTPAVVTRMIKQGINPLEMDFAELNQAAEEIKSSEIVGEDNQKFSEYLWKLEQNRQINEEERSSYIGIYRLIRQVENTDGAAVGALINQGAPLTMKNLLTAVRSEKRSGKMEYTLDEEFDGVNSVKTDQASITDQIEAAYQNNCVKDVIDTVTPESLRMVLKQTDSWQDMTPEQLKQALAKASEQTDETQVNAAYAKEQLENLNQASNAARDIYQILEQYDIPNTMNNVLAMESMMKDRNQIYRKIFGSSAKRAQEDGKVDIDDLKEIKQELLEEFGEAVKEPTAMAEAQEKLGELAENVMKTMINSNEVTSVDIREMKLLSAQLSINSILSKDEQYSVPVMVKDEMMNVSVKIVRGVDKKGIVDIMMESELRGKIAATFQAKEKGISGLIATDSRETKDILENSLAQLQESIGNEAGENLNINCAYIDDLDLNHFSGNAIAKSETETDQNADAYKVQTTRLYHIAESFLRAVKECL